MTETVLPLQAAKFKAQPYTLEVRNTAELDQSHCHCLIYGKTKVGKTSTAITLEEDPTRNRIITTEPEEQLAHLRKHKIPYVRVRNAEELNEALRDPRKLFPGEWSTLIIDDLTEAAEFWREQNEQSIRDGRQVYKAVAADMRNVLCRLLEGDFNLVVTAFERTLADETNTLIWVTPDLPPSTLSLVAAKFSFLFYMTPGRKLLTDRDEARRILAGNRLPKDKRSLFKAEEEPNLQRLWQIFKKAIE